MRHADIVSALRADATVAPAARTDAEVLLDFALRRTKPGHERQPISPLELRRIRASLVALLDAVDAATLARPAHFELVGGDR